MAPSHPSAIVQAAHLRSYRHKERAPVEAALIVEGPLWGSGALLISRLLSNPFLPVLWSMLREDAVAVRCLRLSPGARHFGCNNLSDLFLLGKRRLVCFKVGIPYRCLMPAAADFDGRSFDGRGGTSDDVPDPGNRSRMIAVHRDRGERYAWPVN